MSLRDRIEARKPKPEPQRWVPEWRRQQLERLAKVGRVAEKALER